MLRRWLQNKAKDEHANHEIHCTSLCCARGGQSARVLDLVNDDGEAARLRDLGLHEGATVTVLRHGDPMVVRVDDTRFGLGRKAAEKVLCELL